MKKKKQNSHENITWSEMGKQDVQAKKVCLPSHLLNFPPTRSYKHFDCSRSLVTKRRSAVGKNDRFLRDLASRLRSTRNGKCQAAVYPKTEKLVFLELVSLFFAFAR